MPGIMVMYYRGMSEKRMKTMNVTDTVTMDQDLRYTMTDARYAKGKVALRIPGCDGWKSTAACLLTFKIAPNARWSGREEAYIVSRAQAARFIRAVEETAQRRAMRMAIESGQVETAHV